MSTYNAAIMDKAIELMNRSTNANRRVGAVITNGVGAHNAHMTERESRITVQHAEAQAICRSAAEGIPTKGHDIYVTLSLCVDCAKLIVQSGIAAVYFDKYDPEQPEGLKLLHLGGVEVYGKAPPQDDLPR